MFCVPTFRIECGGIGADELVADALVEPYENDDLPMNSKARAAALNTRIKGCF